MSIKTTWKQRVRQNQSSMRGTRHNYLQKNVSLARQPSICPLLATLSKVVTTEVINCQLERWLSNCFKEFHFILSSHKSYSQVLSLNNGLSNSWRLNGCKKKAYIRLYINVLFHSFLWRFAYLTNISSSFSSMKETVSLSIFLWKHQHDLKQKKTLNIVSLWLGNTTSQN